MSDQDILSQILLNMGDKAPLLLCFLLFVRYMWPSLVALLDKYLTAKAAQPSDDPASALREMAVGLTALQSTFTAFAAEMRQSMAQQCQAWTDAALVITRVGSLVERITQPGVTQSPVSPNQQAMASGETVSDAGISGEPRSVPVAAVSVARGVSGNI